MDLEILRNVLIAVIVLNVGVAGVLFHQRQLIPGMFCTTAALYGVMVLTGVI